jgi:hypothetical protein
MKTLHFQHRGQWFKVTEDGFIVRTDIDESEPSGQWLFLGVSTHHWHRHVTVTLEQAFSKPKSIVGGYVWDCDHGTTRTWGGSYYGKVPRITAAYVTGN